MPCLTLSTAGIELDIRAQFNLGIGGAISLLRTQLRPDEVRVSVRFAVPKVPRTFLANLRHGVFPLSRGTAFGATEGILVLLPHIRHCQ